MQPHVMHLINSQPQTIYPVSPQPQMPAYSPASMKQPNNNSQYYKQANLGKEIPLELTAEEVKIRQNFITPPIKLENIKTSSSNLTSDSSSPPGSEPVIGTGLLKFFNQQHQYGFIVSEKDGTDIFFHYDDVKHTLLSKEFLRHSTENFNIRFSFQILDYIGKYESSKKAVSLNLLSIIAK